MRDSPTKVEMELIEVTPELATAWLDQNTHNRNANANYVDRLARDMANGRFVYTGDPIRFDRTGLLLDGQHRLKAIESSGISQVMLVMYGLPPEVQTHIDGGRKRSPADALALKGYHNTNQLAMMARCIFAEGRGVAPMGNSVLPTTSEVVDIVETIHPQMYHYVQIAGSLPRGVHLGAVSLCNYVGHYALDAADLTQEFVNIIKHGSDDTSCPARAYRERCINAHADGAPLERRISYYSAKKAFNWYISGERKRFTIARDNVPIEGVDTEFYVRGPKRRRKVSAA